MNSNVKTIVQTGQRSFPILGLAFLAMLIMKLANVGTAGTLSWWWVTAPLWAPLSIFLGIMAVILVIFLFIAMLMGVVELCKK